MSDLACDATVSALISAMIHKKYHNFNYLLPTVNVFW